MCFVPVHTTAQLMLLLHTSTSNRTCTLYFNEIFMIYILVYKIYKILNMYKSLQIYVQNLFPFVKLRKQKIYEKRNLPKLINKLTAYNFWFFIILLLFKHCNLVIMYYL